MHRIDTANARPDANGAGKTGYHLNTDLVGVDPTNLDPDALNAIQEELCKVIEETGTPLVKGNNSQLWTAINYLITQQLNTESNDRVNQDLALAIALAAEITNRQNAIDALKSKIPSALAQTVTAGNYYDFTIQPLETIRIFMIGGGGEGGRQSPGGYEVVANDGNNSFLSNQSSTYYVTANGGKRGQGGWYEYQGGAAGVNGVTSIDSASFALINILQSSRNVTPTGVAANIGIGGNGAAPIPNHNAGGKGGYGNVVDCLFTNLSGLPMNLRLFAAADTAGINIGIGGICFLYREPI